MPSRRTPSKRLPRVLASTDAAAQAAELQCPGRDLLAPLQRLFHQQLEAHPPAPRAPGESHPHRPAAASVRPGRPSGGRRRLAAQRLYRPDPVSGSPRRLSALVQAGQPQPRTLCTAQQRPAQPPAPAANHRAQAPRPSRTRRRRGGARAVGPRDPCRGDRASGPRMARTAAPTRLFDRPLRATPLSRHHGRLQLRMRLERAQGHGSKDRMRGLDCELKTFPSWRPTHNLDHILVSRRSASSPPGSSTTPCRTTFRSA
jgi:hypothetical protein